MEELKGDSAATGTPGEKLYRDLVDLAGQFDSVPELRDALFGEPDPRTGQPCPIEGVVRLRTEDCSVDIVVTIRSGRIRVQQDEDPGEEAGATLIFASEDDIAALEQASPDEGVRKFLASDVRLEGNPAVFGFYSYLMSLVDPAGAFSAIEEQKRKNRDEAFELAAKAGKPDRGMRKTRIDGRLRAEAIDPGVHWLTEPYLADYCLADFPRLARFKREHHETLPEVTAEYGELLTDFFLENGYECRNDGVPWDPSLRMAEAFCHVMRHREPLLRDGDLLAGTLTPNPICGAVNHPFTVGWSIWGELNALEHRELDPFAITPETARTLHKKVLPFWMNRHLPHVWQERLRARREKGEQPRADKIYDRMFFLIPWGLVSLNPGSPGFGDAVRKGLPGIRAEIEKTQIEIGANSALDEGIRNEKRIALEAMGTAVEGVCIYTERLADQVGLEARAEGLSEARRTELEEMEQILRDLLQRPAETLHEALQAIWLLFIGIGLDSMDDDIGVGRLDQILQPYFEADMARLKGPKEREAYLERALELVGCFFLRLTSHRIAAATIASWQNSGAPGVASIAVGGVTPSGEDAVNDMTYVILKLTEMLSLDDPDMDARYMSGVNSETFLRRVSEVNYITSGTPAIHNDKQVIAGLRQHGWALEDVRDWVPCGCVEPVVSGKHFAATGDIDSNLMVPLEVALNNGRHPKWNRRPTDEPLGTPTTGEVESFNDFDAFFAAFERQFHFIYAALIEEVSHELVKVHPEVIPAPLYSALLEGCIESGRGMTQGGARYNSSGTSFIGLSDVVDSLLAIKKLVFDGIDGKTIGFRTLMDAVEHDFRGETPGSEEDRCYKRVFAAARYSAAKFGSGDPEARAMADRVTQMVREFFHQHTNDRGGPYTTGYRTNNNHTVFGRVSGASPSGRLANTPFTSGLTPSPVASKNLLDNLIDVGSIDPLTADNSYTLNVRLSFSKKNDHAENVALIARYVDTYFQSGGMQLQFNMVDSDTLMDAMANPEHYPDLIVRVSGYTGYYTRMQQDLQLEIIGRTEFAL
ncbi:MAG: formate acetyltransferase [bacterium]|nr:formate acetyltransferase [bacterium]